MSVLHPKFILHVAMASEVDGSLVYSTSAHRRCICLQEAGCPEVKVQVYLQGAAFNEFARTASHAAQKYCMGSPLLRSINLGVKYSKSNGRPAASVPRWPSANQKESELVPNCSQNYVL